MKTTIDKDVPTPGKPPKPGAPKRWPFEKMEVGDSFFVPAENQATQHKMQSTLMGCVRSRTKNETLPADWKFTTRSVKGGIRIWRVA